MTSMVTVVELLVMVFLITLLIYMRRRMHWKLLKRYPSEISKFVDVSEKYNGERVLMTNYFVQGVSIEQPSIRKSYWYRIAQEILRHAEKQKNPTVLFIGLGGNTSSLLVSRQNPRIHQVIVEIDPVVIKANKEYFSLDELKNTEIITADIFTLLGKKKSAWRNHFDSIVIDTFDAKPPYILGGSHDPAFLDQLYRWLKSDGQFLFNAPVKTKGINPDTLKTYLREHFREVRHEVIRDPRGYRNHVISAIYKK